MFPLRKRNNPYPIPHSWIRLALPISKNVSNDTADSWSINQCNKVVKLNAILFNDSIMRRPLTPKEIAEPECKELRHFFNGLRGFSNEEIKKWHFRSRMALHILLLRLEKEGFGKFPCRCSRCRGGGECLVRKPKSLKYRIIQRFFPMFIK